MGRDGWKQGKEPVKRILVTGVSGTGKSTLSKCLVKESRRLIVQDNLAEWGATCTICTSWHHVYEEVTKPTFRIAVQLEDDPTDVAATLARIARSSEVGACVLVYEELSLIFGVNRIASPAMQALVRFGRRERVSCIFISQRVYDCPIDIRSQLTDVISFRSHEPRDLEHLAKMVGREKAQKVLALRGHSYYRYDLTTDEEPRMGGRANVECSKGSSYGDRSLPDCDVAAQDQAGFQSRDWREPVEDSNEN